MRDIAGWWEDCGCSGEAIGGIARLRATTAGAGKVAYLFVGRTVLPYAEGRSTPEGALIDTAPWYAGASVAVFESLESAYWLPDEVERSVLLDKADSPLAKFAVSSVGLVWEGVTLVWADGRLIVEELKESLPLPAAKRRATEVGVLAKWQRGADEAGLALDRKLSALAPLSATVPDAKQAVLGILGRAEGSSLAYWRRQVVRTLAEDPALASRVSAATLARLHAPGAAGPYLEGLGNDRVVKQQYDTCGRCHEEAFKQWVESPHAKSMITLRSRMRQKDLSCLPCHTQKYEAAASGGIAKPGYDAVTCVSCHSNNQPAKNVCEVCHTTLTDPKRVWAKHVGSICSDSKASGGACSR